MAVAGAVLTLLNCASKVYVEGSMDFCVGMVSGRLFVFDTGLSLSSPRLLSDIPFTSPISCR